MIVRRWQVEIGAGLPGRRAHTVDATTGRKTKDDADGDDPFPESGRTQPPRSETPTSTQTRRPEQACSRRISSIMGATLQQRAAGHRRQDGLTTPVAPEGRFLACRAARSQAAGRPVRGNMFGTEEGERCEHISGKCSVGGRRGRNDWPAPREGRAVLADHDRRLPPLLAALREARVRADGGRADQRDRMADVGGPAQPRGPLALANRQPRPSHPRSTPGPCPPVAAT
jgi:hypothetical protein